MRRHAELFCLLRENPALNYAFGAYASKPRFVLAAVPDDRAQTVHGGTGRKRHPADRYRRWGTPPHFLACFGGSALQNFQYLRSGIVLDQAHGRQNTQRDPDAEGKPTISPHGHKDVARRPRGCGENAIASRGRTRKQTGRDACRACLPRDRSAAGFAEQIRATDAISPSSTPSIKSRSAASNRNETGGPSGRSANSA